MFRTPTGVKPTGEVGRLVDSLLKTHDCILVPGDSQIVTLADGRELGFAIYGSRSSKAQRIVLFHGSPGSRLTYAYLDGWGRKNDIMLICPKRPGYGLTTFHRKWTVYDHAHDALWFMGYLGYRRYTVHGTSGGAPFAQALTYAADHLRSFGHEVIATQLIVPAAPSEATRFGQAIKGYTFDLKAAFIPRYLEWEHRKQYKEILCYVEEVNASGYWPASKMRKTKDGRKWLQNVEELKEPKAYVWERRSLETFWGFELEDKRARKIVIWAGGLDRNTPLKSIEYMKDRLQNCELIVKYEEDHGSIQERYDWQMKEQLKRM